MNQNNLICLLQARMSSSRLPKKVLMPIGEIPLVVLAAKRAANQGAKVLVVTSTDASDDDLVAVLKDYDIDYFRGSLNNTLARFNDALVDESDETVVVRLTGDNIFPDGQFIDDVVQYFINGKLNYLGTTDIKTGLPYGLSAEVFRVKDIRAAHSSDCSGYSQEHVTPDIIQRYGANLFLDKSSLNMGHLRATIDTQEDYLWIKQLFESIEQPLEIGFLELCQRLNVQYREKQRARLVIGCAQLGLNYGITNLAGKPIVANVARLFDQAEKLCINTFDTAQAYGNSEEVISAHIHSINGSEVITKLQPFNQAQLVGLSDEKIAFEIEKSLTQFSNVKTHFLLHRANHIWECEGRVWQQLLELKKRRKIDKVGVSVQSPQELEKVLAIPHLDIIQLPINILDNRWNNAIELLIQYKSKRDVEVHGRSVFLQGLLLSQQPKLWQRAHSNIETFKQVTHWLESTKIACQCLSLKELLIRYVASLPWCDKLVVGMQNAEELVQVVDALDCLPLTNEQMMAIETTRPQLNELTLDPVNWKDN